ncbi:hypothetical protein [Zooshikella harenae]|uniref:Uncharacterized protein n=1 Tax=Zooshikella harenae TaxID=2827238 RepID=A0ABS5ZB41_9GAMM|nr:hypothetical protein [Zooshikella harenae]MBU2711245.1 hypothetical protein [Zooshikella harenae]
MKEKLIRRLNKVKAFLDSSLVEQKEQANSIKKVLKKLKQKQKSLEKELNDEKSKRRRAELQDEIAIIKERRKKGIQALQDLNGKPSE